MYVHRVPKTSTFYFLNNCVKNLPILVIFGMCIPEKIWHENLTDCPPRLSDVATVPWEIEKKSFSTVLFIYILFIIYVISQENKL